MDIIKYLQDLILMLGTPTFVGILAAYVLTYNRYNTKRLKDGDDRFNRMEQSIRTIGLVSLRHEIMSNEMPIRERIRAYEQYKKDFNGNGYMDEYYEKILLPLVDKEITGQEN